MATGKVKWFNIQKGYGFIVSDEDGKEIFVHYRDVLGNSKGLRDNDSVEYEVEEGEKGLQATGVKVVR